ncbi:hypothetical protein [Umezawaea tangerina]|uniref:Uncharacterized protein n=1 Tax=Umezawaea tangerina TaxID=84725 RepID=A0A2T0SS98_9PSEU|nr:hypothetical protein [Umezawaea tangerina]PRY36276.1 hypothetical protein CLV43_112203 [Umezawaea tangerina]
MLQTITDLPAPNLRSGDQIPSRGIVSTTTTVGTDVIAILTNGNRASFATTARVTVYRPA